MNLSQQMHDAAREIRDRLASGLKVAKEDLAYLQSYNNIITRTAPNAGKRKRTPLKQKVWSTL